MAKTRAPKANQAVKQKRLDQVIQLRGQGYMRYQLLVMLSKEWNMTERGVGLYWDASSKILKEGFTDEDLISGYKEIHRRTLEESPAISLKALDSIVKLKKGDKIEIQHNITTSPIQIIFGDSKVNEATNTNNN